MPKVAEAAQDDKIQAYNLPQGVISKLYRSCASGSPGLFTRVGLHTYVDPRLGGGKVNTKTKEDLVKLVEVDGKEWLFYKATPIDVALIRATSADPFGNLSMEKEALTLDVLAQAMARAQQRRHRHRAGGTHRPPKARSSRRTSRFRVFLVDCVVIADPLEMHRMNYGVMYDPGLAGEVRVTVDSLPTMELDERKIIARRAAFELPPNGVINLGVGAPDGVANVANEEKVTPYLVMTTEAGAVGGVLAGGSSFGSSANAHSIPRPEPDVRLLPRRRSRPHLPRHGGMRQRRQRQHQQSSAASSTAAAASSTFRRTRARWSSPARSRRAGSKSRSRTARSGS